MRHVAALLAALVAASPAGAELPRPDCEILEGWAAGHQRGAGWQPNALSLGGRDRFGALFAAPETGALFGRPVLEWTPEEARALAPQLQACAEAARRDPRQREAAAALSALRGQAGREVPAYLEALRGAREAAPRALAALEASEPPLPLLRFHAALAALGAGDGREAQAAAQALPPAQREAARALLGALRDLPAPEASAMLGRAADRLPALRAAAADALAAEAASAPDAVARRLPEHAAALGPEASGRVEAAIAATRARLSAERRAALERQVAGVSPNPMGAAMLDQLRARLRGPDAAVLTPEDARAVEAAIAARRAALGPEMVTALREEMAEAPATTASLAALRGLETGAINPAAQAILGPDGVRAVREAAAARRAALAPEVAGSMLEDAAEAADSEALHALEEDPALPLLPGAEAERVRAGLAVRRAALAEAMLPRFRSGLAALPGTQDGLSQMDETVLPGSA